MNCCIIDTNVLYLAGTPIDEIPDDQLLCAQKCIAFLKGFMNNPQAKIVIDDAREIYKEYVGAYKKAKSNSPNLALRFFKWLFSYLQNIPSEDLVHLTPGPQKGEYAEYPSHPDLALFDPSDRKFIAVANAHPKHPPIVEGTDSKWWGIKDVLKKFGIRVVFVDAGYIETKYRQKIG